MATKAERVIPDLSIGRLSLTIGSKPKPVQTRPVSEILAEISKKDTEMRLKAAVFLKGRGFRPKIQVQERRVVNGGNAWGKAREWAGVFEGRVTQNAQGLSREYRGVGWRK